jgi:undecaprenyl-diphosphatase
MAFYGLLIIILLARVKGKKKFAAAFLLGLLVLLIGFSRIYVGVHYASDVIAGLCEGFVWLGVVCRIPWVSRAIAGTAR